MPSRRKFAVSSLASICPYALYLRWTPIDIAGAVAGFYALYPGFATNYFLPNFRSVRADPRFMPFAEKIGRVD